MDGIQPWHSDQLDTSFIVFPPAEPFYDVAKETKTIFLALRKKSRAAANKNMATTDEAINIVDDV